ncbi:hypothetical protein ACFLWB_01975 [Chloroflexota bacterium]
MKTITSTIILTIIVGTALVSCNWFQKPFVISGVPVDPNFSASWGSEKFPQSKGNQILAKAGFWITDASVSQQSNQVDADRVSAQSLHVFHTKVGSDDYKFTGDSDYSWERISASEWNEMLILNLESEDTGFAFSGTYERHVTSDGSVLLIDISDQVWREDLMMPRERIVLMKERLTITPVDQTRTKIRVVQDMETTVIPSLRLVEERLETKLAPDSIQGESQITITLGQEMTEITTNYQRTPTPNVDQPYGAFQSNPFWLMNAEYSRYDIVINGSPKYTLKGRGVTELKSLGHNPLGEDLLITHIGISLVDPSGNILNLGADQEIKVDTSGNISVTATGNSTGRIAKLFIDPFHDTLPIPLPPALKAAITVAAALFVPINEFFTLDDLWIGSPGTSSHDECQTKDFYRTNVLNFAHTELDQNVTRMILEDNVLPDPMLSTVGPRYGANSMSISYLNGTGKTIQATLTFKVWDDLGNRVVSSHDITIPGCK